MQVAIVGVVVMDAIAGKSLVFKEERAEESGDFSRRRTFGMPFLAKFFRELIEALLIMGNIDIWIGDLGDEERPLFPIHLSGTMGNEGAEFLFELLKKNFISDKSDPGFQCRIIRAGLFQKR